MTTEANTVLSEKQIEQVMRDFVEDTFRAARHIPALCATVKALRAENEKLNAIVWAYENNDEEAHEEAEKL